MRTIRNECENCDDACLVGRNLGLVETILRLLQGTEIVVSKPSIWLGDLTYFCSKERLALVTNQ